MRLCSRLFEGTGDVTSDERSFFAPGADQAARTLIPGVQAPWVAPAQRPQA